MLTCVQEGIVRLRVRVGWQGACPHPRCRLMDEQRTTWREVTSVPAAD
jgi:hypothetical protein